MSKNRMEEKEEKEDKEKATRKRREVDPRYILFKAKKEEEQRKRVAKETNPQGAF